MTSEPQHLATLAQQDWEFGFEAIGDPHQEISGTCREREWLELYVNEKVDLLGSSANWKPSHPKGYFQPGVIALASSGRVLYRWRSIPTRKNMGGATERPTAMHVGEAVFRALEEPDDSDDALLDLAPPLDSRGIPWPLFVSLLVANGWFVRPRGFIHLSGGPTPQQRVLKALFRIIAFVAGWASAFIYLPTLWVALGFGLWLAWITPRIRLINAQFQNEPAV